MMHVTGHCDAQCDELTADSEVPNGFPWLKLPMVNRQSVSASGPPVHVTGAGPLMRSVVLGSPAPQLDAPQLRRNRGLPAGMLTDLFHHRGGLILPVFHFLLC